MKLIVTGINPKAMHEALCSQLINGDSLPDKLNKKKLISALNRKNSVNNINGKRQCGEHLEFLLAGISNIKHEKAKPSELYIIDYCSPEKYMELVLRDVGNIDVALDIATREWQAISNEIIQFYRLNEESCILLNSSEIARNDFDRFSSANSESEYINAVQDVGYLISTIKLNDQESIKKTYKEITTFAACSQGYREICIDERMRRVISELQFSSNKNELKNEKSNSEINSIVKYYRESITQEVGNTVKIKNHYKKLLNDTANSKLAAESSNMVLSKRLSKQEKYTAVLKEQVAFLQNEMEHYFIECNKQEKLVMNKDVILTTQKRPNVLRLVEYINQ